MTESSINRADHATDDLQDLRSRLKFRMAEAEGDDDFLVVGPIKADQEPFSGELDLFQDEFSDEVLIVVAPVPPPRAAAFRRCTCRNPQSQIGVAR